MKSPHKKFITKFYISPATDKGEVTRDGGLEHVLIKLPLLALSHVVLGEVQVLPEGDPVPVSVQDAALILSLSTDVSPDTDGHIREMFWPGTPTHDLETVEISNCTKNEEPIVFNDDTML